ncbi:MAG: trimeric intracellular cation channel family protein [Acidimicrobiia bacterium]
MAPSLLGVDETLLLVLNLAGTFVFGLSGGMAAVRARLDVFGVIVLAAVVGMAGGITRDVLVGIPPETFRDGRYLAVAGTAGLVTIVGHRLVARIERPVLVLDAAGLALFCVTGAATALATGVGPVGAVVLGAITGVGGGVLRDILLRQVPVVLREGLYAIPALIGATIVVAASELDWSSDASALAGAAVCFATRVAGIYLDLGVPRPPGDPPPAT